MNDPFRRFQQQPWLPLIKIAALTTSVVIFVEGTLILLIISSPVFARSASLILSGVLEILISVLASAGVGAFGVYLCERCAQEVDLDRGSLWALVLCLIIGMGLKSLLPFPQLLVQFSSTACMGVVVGVFWKGRPYWSRFW